MRPVITALAILVLAAVPGGALAGPGTGPPKKTVAVLRFDNNSGDSQYDALGKGIAAMMITDLSSVQSIQLVERERLQDVTNELNLQHSPMFDPKTAASVGKLAGAQYVVTGSILALDPKMRLDTRVIRVETGEIVKTAQVTGEEKKFFDMQQKLAKELLDGLDVALSPEDAERLKKQQAADSIANLKITLQYSQALDLFDRHMYTEAAAKMLPVVRAQPDSRLFQTTYKLMSDRAKSSAEDKAKNKLKGWLKRKIG